MFPRNLTFFRYPTTHSLAALPQGLQECALKPVAPLELSSRGFVSPFGRDSDELLASIGAATWITIGGEDRLLPGAVVNDLLTKKLAEIEQREGRRPGGRTRKRIKDELIVDLMPRAFVRPCRTDVVLDADLGLVMVDTAGRKVAEGAVSEIRRAIGSFPAMPLNAEVSPRSVLTGWVAGEELPDGLSIGDECEMQDPADTGSKARFTRHELESEEVGRHLDAGLQVTRLALTLDDHVSFVLGEDLALRKFKLLDGALDGLDHSDADGLRAEMDARFSLFSAEARRVFKVLERAFKISRVEA